MLSAKEKIDACLVSDPSLKKDSFVSSSKNVKLKPRMSMSRHYLGMEVSRNFPMATMEEFMSRYGGVNPMNKILIATNGFAATKFIRSIRRWCKEMFKNERAIKIIVMATAEDMSESAEFINLADQCASLAGGNETFANTDVILEVAARAKVNAVWPGWDAGARNAKLAEALQKKKMVYMGPSPHTLSLASDTINTLILAQSIGIPTLQWNGSGTKIAGIEQNKKIRIPESVYDASVLLQADKALNEAKIIGFPVAIKPATCGERGVRVVEHPNDFSARFHQLQYESHSPIIVMKHIQDARYVEIQLLGDCNGNVISVFTRDCTIQRHNQKIVEEAPAIFAMPKFFEDMERAAIRMGKLLKLEGVATVLFLYCSAESSFFFLDFYPYLQPEHGCTEMLANVNLCACQMQIAMGLPLNCIKDVREMLNETPWECNSIDFGKAGRAARSFGHSIAVRIMSDDFEENPKPLKTGTIRELGFHTTRDVWGYYMVANYKHQSSTPFGHLFAWGENRNDARLNLIAALRELSIKADIVINIGFLITLLESSEFVHNAFYTSYYNRIIAEQTKVTGRPEMLMGVIAASVHIADRHIGKLFSDHQGVLEKGNIQSPELLTNHLDVELVSDNLKYKVVAVKTGEDLYTLIMNDSYKEIVVHRLPDGGLFMTLDNMRHSTHMMEEFGRYYVTVGNKNCVFYKGVNPMVLRAPSPGKLVSLLVRNGDELAKDQPYAELEVMKATVVLCSQESGVVHFMKSPGEYLDQDEVIGQLELPYFASVPQVASYTGGWQLGEQYLKPEGHIRMLNKYRSILSNMLAGFCFPEPYHQPCVNKAVKSFIGYLKSPRLPLEELRETIKIPTGIPRQVEKRIHQIINTYESNIDSVMTSFPADKIAHVIDDYALSLQQERERDAFFVKVQEILQLVRRYRSGGVRNHVKSVLNVLLRQYCDDESHFQHSLYFKCIDDIREKYKQDMKAVMSLVFSHAQVAKKNDLVMLLLKETLVDSQDLTEDLTATLYDLTQLRSEVHSRVALKARKFLIASHTPSYEMRRNQLESILLSAAEEAENESGEGLKLLIESETAIFDALHEFFYSSNVVLANIAMEIYIRRVYAPFAVTAIQHREHQLHHKRTAVPAVYYRFELRESFRLGCIAAINGVEYYYELIDAILSEFEEVSPPTERKPIFVIKMAIRKLADVPDDQMSKLLQSLCLQHREDLITRRIHSITFLVLRDKHFPRLFTYRVSSAFGEDWLMRNLETAEFFQLEIARMSSYEIKRLQTENSRMHLFLGSALTMQANRKVQDWRFFVRAIIRHSDLITRAASFEYLMSEGEKALVEAIEELEIATVLPCAKKTDSNHIFLAFLPCVVMDPLMLREAIIKMTANYTERLWKLRVLQVEMKFTIQERGNFRVLVSSELGYFVEVLMYAEVPDSDDPSVVRFKSMLSYGPIIENGPLEGLATSTTYKTRDFIQQKRFQVQAQHTTYCYDYPDMFRQMTELLWQEFHTSQMWIRTHKPDSVLLECNELVLVGDKLAEVKRPPGENTISIVAWRLRLATPEFPAGRELILVANDLTLSGGSFGITEAIFFQKASQLARIWGVPRVLISCNTGVRAGLADNLKSMFRIAWRDRDDLDKGCKYLYLSSADFSTISSENIVRTSFVEEEGEPRYRITDIIGTREGLGIESLHFASMIESETAQAYDDIVTVSMVTSKTGGIGAHIVALGRRVVMIEGSAMMLTKYPALNRSLGSDAYESNQQIGGCEIMARNGVAHQIDSDVLAGIHTMLHWLSYTPDKRNGPLPIVESSDDIDRRIDFTPTKSHYDPRFMLGGHFLRDRWESGFFDRHSWSEILQSYAPTVIVGRARLGGIPVGVVAPEIRVVETKIPSDPGKFDPEERVVTQVGKIIYSDSAQKMAHAIQCFNREQLPLMIFANWRGISSGTTSMMRGILNFTTLIIEALREYKQPVFIYLPPRSELRGGTWNLFSSFINPQFIEMYADADTRAGSYDPETVVQKRFRSRDLKKVIHCLDPDIAAMKEEMRSITNEQAERRLALGAKVKERTQRLIQPYVSAAVEFADLHDTPERLIEKGCIGEIVPWRTSRTWFYWRLKRMLLTNHFIKLILESDEHLNCTKAALWIRHWFVEDKAHEHLHLWEDNKLVSTWLEEQKEKKDSFIHKRLEDLQKKTFTLQVQASLERNPDTVLDAIVGLCNNIPPEHRREVIHLLTQLALEKFEAKFGHE